MKERPIIFSPPMVRAILEGRKTQTRRIMKPQPWSQEMEDNGPQDPAHTEWEWPIPGDKFGTCMGMGSDAMFFWPFCPYGMPGDQLYVRESFAYVGTLDPGYLTYKATYPSDLPAHVENVPVAIEEAGHRWKPAIHMPKAISRIQLEITHVRLEQLNDITPEDAQAEGIEPLDTYDFPIFKNYLPGAPSDGFQHAPSSFKSLWISLYGLKSWEANPWLWVIEFRKLDKI